MSLLQNVPMLTVNPDCWKIEAKGPTYIIYTGTQTRGQHLSWRMGNVFCFVFSVEDQYQCQ